MFAAILLPLVLFLRGKQVEAFEPAIEAGALCAAVCLRQFGTWNATGPHPTLQAFNGLSCVGSPCRECLLPCQTRVGGRGACETLCSRWNLHQSSLWQVCASSCRRYFAAFDRLVARPAAHGAAYFRIARFRVACVQASPEQLRLTLAWQLEAAGSRVPLARLPVVFLIEVSSEGAPASRRVSPFVLQGRANVDGLTKNANYSFRVRGIDFQGNMVDSKAELYLRDAYRHFVLNNLRANLTLKTSASVSISWRSNVSVCRYQVVLVRMKKIIGNVKGPFQMSKELITYDSAVEHSVFFEKIAFGHEYLAKVKPAWPTDGNNFADFTLKFKVPPCSKQECFDHQKRSRTELSTPDSLGLKLFEPRQALPITLSRRASLAQGSQLSAPQRTTSSNHKDTSRVLLASLLPLAGTIALLLILFFIRLARHHFSFRAAFAPKSRTNLAYEAEDGPPDPYEVPFSSIRLQEEVGRGEFGVVHRGLFLGPGDGLSVAVKLLQPEKSGVTEVRAFREEITIMKALGQHPNVLSLLACCTKPDGPLCLVTDFCEHGSLLDYLPRLNDDIVEENRLLTFACDVAAGMEFLTSRRFVHRDLACRNVLLDRHLTAKVADFGLSRDVYQDSLYRWETERRLPFRWMAPETLMKRIFTHASDVWSFGLVLWEIFSLGAMPFALFSGPELVKALEAGERPPKPILASNQVFEIMEHCWAFETDQRPTFGDLRKDLLALLSPSDTESVCKSQAFSELSFDVNSFGYLNI